MRSWLPFASIMAAIMVSDAFTPGHRYLASSSSSFTQRLRPFDATPRLQDSRQKGIELHMMFDQLAAALSDVTRNFGPKKR